MMNQHIQNLVKIPCTWKYNEDGTKTKKTFTGLGGWNKVIADKNPKSSKFIIRTGKQFGIIVVDVDIKHGENGQDTLLEYDIDMDEYPTLTFRTPSGGLHYFYNWKQGLVDANYLPYIDMIDHAPKGDKDEGWFVFHDTEKYICENDIPIADMPDELYNLFIDGHAKYVAQQSETKEIPTVEELETKEEPKTDSDEQSTEFVNIKREPLRMKKQEEKQKTSKQEPKIDIKHYDLLKLLNDKWFKSYDNWAEPAYALYNAQDITNEVAFNTWIKLLKEKAGDKYDYDGARNLWVNSIPKAQKEIIDAGGKLITIAKFKKDIGCNNNALYSIWKDKYEPAIVKSKTKTKTDLKNEEEEQYNQLVDDVSNAINEHGRCMMYDENDVSFSDVNRLHRQTIAVKELALLFNRSFVCLHQRGGLNLIIKENTVERCKFTNTYKTNTVFTKIDFNKEFDRKIKVNIVLDEDTTLPLVKLFDLIFDISTTIPNYESMGFYPCGPKNVATPPKRVFNIFSGFLHKYDKDYVPRADTVNTFISMYKEILCNNNQQSFDFEINKLAHIIQYPEIKSESVSIFQGEQGTGKSFLLMFLMMYVFGKHLSLTIFQSEQLLNKFNSHLMGKLFIILEEAVDLGNLKDISKVKGYIRCPVLNIEFKGINVSESLECCMNFFIATNNDYNAMFRETGERTANYNHINDKYCRNTTFFKQMSDILNNFDAGKDIFHYLANIDLSSFNIKEVPETDDKFNKKLESTNSFFKFLHTLYCDDMDIKADDMYNSDDVEYERNGNQVQSYPIDLNRTLVDLDDGYMKIMKIYNSYKWICKQEFGIQDGGKGMFSKNAIKQLLKEFVEAKPNTREGREEYLMTKKSIGDALNKKFNTTKFTE